MPMRSLLKFCMMMLEALALLADQVFGRHAAIVEMQRRGIRRPPAHLLQLRARQARRVALDQQQADAARALTAGAHGDREIIGAHARGDEGLLAVDDVVIAVAARLGAQIGDIGAAARLGNRQRGDFLARQHLRQHPRLISGRAARAIGGEPMVWLIRLALTPPAPARASSCEATIFMNWSAGVPPYSSGKPRPSRPISAALAYSSRGNSPASSHSWA